MPRKKAPAPAKPTGDHLIVVDRVEHQKRGTVYRARCTCRWTASDVDESAHLANLRANAHRREKGLELFR